MIRVVATGVVTVIAVACNYHHLAFEHQIADAVETSYESDYNDDYDVPPFSRILVPIHTDYWWQTLCFYLFRVLVTLAELAIPFLTWKLSGPQVHDMRGSNVPGVPAAAPAAPVPGGVPDAQKVALAQQLAASGQIDRAKKTMTARAAQALKAQGVDTAGYTIVGQ